MPGMFAWAAGTITHPFAGVTCIAREEACPRPVKMHILLCRDYQVCDAINLDGGGSTTLCMSDPVPRAVSVPVGLNGTPGTLRPVGSNLAIFAPPAKQ